MVFRRDTHCFERNSTVLHLRRHSEKHPSKKVSDVNVCTRQREKLRH